MKTNRSIQKLVLQAKAENNPFGEIYEEFCAAETKEDRVRAWHRLRLTRPPGGRIFLHNAIIRHYSNPVPPSLTQLHVAIRETRGESPLALVVSVDQAA
jgi:hypothetical protein